MEAGWAKGRSAQVGREVAGHNRGGDPRVILLQLLSTEVKTMAHHRADRAEDLCGCRGGAPVDRAQDDQHSFVGDRFALGHQVQQCGGSKQAAEAALKKLFAFSILWLFLIFSLIVVERALGIAAFPSVLG